MDVLSESKASVVHLSEENPPCSYQSEEGRLLGCTRWMLYHLV